ncbi:glycoside hydrolase superfamily [Stachybotrys elegans]|uniref:glucan 1,3-beta-glucosidase n=1 Tax=Stachybotrys elegans TaxID=80388 RepID=A0A8K0SRX6_9HYPO|nr:glycoside hydrolase superfamily [Stachybotrys elegans]
MAPRASGRPKHRQSERHDRHERHERRERHAASSSRNPHRSRRPSTSRPATSSDEAASGRRSNGLSADALAQLNRDNARQSRKPERPKRVRREDYKETVRNPDRVHKQSKGRKKRVVSGAIVEEGRAPTRLRGGGWSEDSYEKEDFYQRPEPKRRKKKLWIAGGVAVVIIIIIIVAVVVSQQNNGGGGGDPSDGSSNLDDMDRSDIPERWQNTYLDPFSWTTTDDFNTTFTDRMVGDLPVMGLFDEWDDSARANERVPPLDESWGSYEQRPARGVNLGGWLQLEAFITPSLFRYDVQEGVIDEWTLCEKLGSSAGRILEGHYANFVTEETFRDIRDAGLDHVRIPFSYWAIEVYDGDPYVFRTSWRYLLRGIEWARKYGIRVNLDIHGLPGSQNGWDHSGRYGSIEWLNGTNGQLNADRSIEIHDRLSTFFAQDRYKNIISHYGLANEPRMTFLEASEVIAWTEKAYNLVRDNGIEALVIFGDGFMGLNNWQGLMTGHDDLVLDVHQYVIFNENQIDFTRKEKVEYACQGWTDQAELSMDRSTGYGPTLFAEWSQADSDCAPFLTGVGRGNRWEGTYDTGDSASSILTPRCPTKDDRCTCDRTNSDPSRWPQAYKDFLQMFAEAQMHSFEKGLGWWYWTWKTERATLWSYEAGLQAGILPEKAYDREFNCDSTVPDFGAEGLPEYM